MNVDAIKFPVICFWRDLIRIKLNETDFTITTKAGLKNGMFADLFVVDSSLNGFKVKSAKKRHGVGPFWGYTIFLNQKIKVELAFEDMPKKVSLEEVKERVFRSFRKWHGWATRGDFSELQDKVKNATSISDIIRLLDT